jgi:predicted GH43/DUF377 family glycosyl hydrolase
MAVKRYEKNPIITPAGVTSAIEGFEVIGAFNPAVAQFNDQVILLLRVAERPVNDDKNILKTALYDQKSQSVVTKIFPRSRSDVDFSDSRFIIAPEGKFLTSLSYFRIARSTDGFNFTIDDSPFLFPSENYELFGLEDPRITQIADTYYITYVAVSPLGVVTCLAATKDFRSVKRLGVISLCDNKDVVLFPAKIYDSYWLLQRPVSAFLQTHDIWISQSPDLKHFGEHQFLAAPRPGQWDSTKIGAGAVPFLTDDGWLCVYHGVDDKGIYALGALLLDKNNPAKLIARSKSPFMIPETPYEKSGFFNQVVFTCGLIKSDNTLKIYYGAADTTTAYAQIPLSDVINSLE